MLSKTVESEQIYMFETSNCKRKAENNWRDISSICIDIINYRYSIVDSMCGIDIWHSHRAKLDVELRARFLVNEAL